MELKLVVLAGAKEGTQIPLKKEKFIIGRATECTLRAGSSAISRRHCAIIRKDDTWFVRDLGSRNGTLLNDTAVEKPTPLKVGDEIRVGPLHFRVEQYVKSAEGSKPGKSTVAAAEAVAPAKSVEPPTVKQSVEPFEAQDINRSKQPRVKDIGEVVARTAKQADDFSSEEDISRWLLGIDPGGGGDIMRETQTLSMEETTAINRTISSQETASPDVAETAESPAVKPAEPVDEKSGSGGWSLFKKKSVAKKSPGKLPPRAAEASKDSREAAADILREMTRRR